MKHPQYKYQNMFTHAQICSVMVNGPYERPLHCDGFIDYLTYRKLTP